MVAPKYGLVLSPSAESFLEGATKLLRGQIGYDMHLLQMDPHREGVKKLKGKMGKKAAYRFRSGDYRIVFHIDEIYVVVDVVKIGPRGSVYE